MYLNLGVKGVLSMFLNIVAIYLSVCFEVVEPVDLR